MILIPNPTKRILVEELYVFYKINFLIFWDFSRFFLGFLVIYLKGKRKKCGPCQKLIRLSDAS